MKKVVLLLSVIFSCVALADPWPFDPVCRSYGAESETVMTLSTQPEKIVLCKFGLQAYVDKNSLGRSAPTLAVSSYFQNDDLILKSCSHYGATVVQARNDRHQIFELCRFFDRSFMESETFRRGPDSVFNDEMTAALRRN